MHSSDIYDVFVSYSHADKPRVLHLVDALQKANIHFFLDEKDIDCFEGITPRVVESIGRSKALLAFYSVSYPTRTSCLYELREAYVAGLGKGDDKSRVLVVNPESDLSHIYPEQLRDQRMRIAFDTQDPEHLEWLVEKIRRHVRGLLPIGAFPAYRTPRWFGSRPVGSRRFVGRIADHWRVYSALHEVDVPLTSGSMGGAIAQLIGMAGVGKTLLAENYASYFAAAYPGGIFWLSMSDDGGGGSMTDKQLRARRLRELNALADELGLQIEGERSLDALTGVLAEELAQRGICLWVVDGVLAGLKTEELKAWFAPAPNARTLLTTRSREYGSVAMDIPLDNLDPDDALKLLTAGRCPVGLEEQEAARGIVQDLGRHALAIDVTGVALAKAEGLTSFSEFRHSLQNPNRDALALAEELSGVLPTGHEKSIAVTLLRSIQCLPPEGRRFLRVVALLSRDPVPAGLVAAIFAVMDETGAAAGNEQAILAIDQTERVSLSDRVAPTGHRIHPLVSRTIRYYEHLADVLRMRNAAVRALAEILSQEERHADVESNWIVTHAEHLTEDVRTVAEAELKGQVGRWYLERGFATLALEAFEQEHEVLKGELSPEARKSLAARNNVGRSLRKLDRLDEARATLRRVLRAQRRHVGAADLDTLTTMNNLAEVLRDLGRPRRSRRLHQKVLAERRRLLGPEHKDTLLSMNNLAGTCKKLDLHEARRLQEEVLDILIAEFGEHHERTIAAMNNLTCTYLDLERNDMAFALGKRAFDLAVVVLAEDHSYRLSVMHTFAKVLLAREKPDLSGAADINRRVLAARARTFGDRHSSTTEVAWHLYLMLMGMREPEEADAVFRDYLRWILDAGVEMPTPAHRRIRAKLVRFSRSPQTREAMIAKFPEVAHGAVWRRWLRSVRRGRGLRGEP